MNQQVVIPPKPRKFLGPGSTAREGDVVLERFDRRVGASGGGAVHPGHCPDGLKVAVKVLIHDEWANMNSADSDDEVMPTTFYPARPLAHSALG